MHSLINKTDFIKDVPAAVLQMLRARVQGSKNIGEKVLRLGALYACHDMARLSCAVGLGEEHITASLMGHLASHLQWLRVIAQEMYPNDVEIPEIIWAYQNARQEAQSGSDFALIADQSSHDEPTTTLRIALFQAKKLQPGSQIKVDHITRSTNQTEGLNWTRDAKRLLNAARRQMLSAGQGVNLRGIEALLLRDMQREHYQLEALLRTHFRGHVLANSDRRWVYYSIWRKDDLPSVEDIGNIVINLYSRSDFAKPMTYTVKGGVRFHDILADALYSRGEFGLELNINKVDSFIEGLQQTLPQIDFLLAGKKSIDPRVKHALRKTHVLSPPLVKPIFRGVRPSIKDDPLKSLGDDRDTFSAGIHRPK